MNMYELMSVAKLFSQAMDGKITTSYAEQDMALRILKEMSNYRQGWTEEQKEYYKLMVEYGKELLRKREECNEGN